MLFSINRFCVRFGKIIALAVLLMLLEAFIISGTVTAIENEDDVLIFGGAERWRFHDLDGSSFELGRFKGKVIFINIWATWCVPCIFEMPSIEKLYNAFQNEDIVFLIASNEDKNTVQKFYEKNNFKFPVYLIDRVPSAFQTMGIPSSFIINREGQIVLRHMGTADWNDQSCHEFIRALLSPQSDKINIVKPVLRPANNQEIPKEMKNQLSRNIPRSFISSRLEPFIEQNDLSPDVKSKLIDIRVEEQQKMMDFTSSKNPPQDLIRELNQIRSDCDEKISKLLSAKIFAAYKQYQKYENEWATISDIRKDFEFQDIKLEKDQEQQLVAAMYNARQGMMETQRRKAQEGEISVPQSQEEMLKYNYESQKNIFSKYMQSAKNILDDSQLKIFHRYFDNQLYMMERALIGRSQLSIRSYNGNANQ